MYNEAVRFYVSIAHTFHVGPFIRLYIIRFLYARQNFDGTFYGNQISGVRPSVRRKHVAPLLENDLSNSHET